MAICLRSFPNRFITVNVNNFITTRKHVHRTVSSRDHPNESLYFNKFSDDPSVSNSCLFNSPLNDECIESHFSSNRIPKCPISALPNHTALVKGKCTISDDIILWKTGIGSEVMKLSDIHSTLPIDDIHVSSILSDYEKDVLRNYRFHSSSVTEICSQNVDSFLHFSSELSEHASQNPEPKSSPSQDSSKATNEQLENVLQILSNDLSHIFVRAMDYTIYEQDLIFENNYRGVRTVGLSHYATSIAFLKIVGHMKFAYIKLDILKITKHPEDGTVRVRWRIKGLSGLKVFLLFWRIKVWKLKESLKEHETWYDGFSVFHVNGNGKIYKHVVDKMQPDDDKEELVQKTPLAAKLGLLLGLTPRSSTLTDLSPMTWAGLTELSRRRAELDAQSVARLMLPLQKIE